PERREVRRDRKGLEDLAVLLLEPCDLSRVIRRPVLIGARIDDRETGLLQRRPEDRAHGVAVGVVRPHHAYLLVRLDGAVLPVVDELLAELADAEAEVVTPLERRRLAGGCAAPEVPRFPWLNRRDLRDAGGLARVGDWIVRLGRRRRDHQVDLVAVDQLLGQLTCAWRIRLVVPVDDLDGVVLPS